MWRGRRSLASAVVVTLGLAACVRGTGPAPSPPTIEAVGVVTDVRIYPDHTRYVFTDGSVHEVTSDYRELGESAGFGLVVIGSDAEGRFVAGFPLQAGLPADCYRDNGVGVERGTHIQLRGVLFEKAPGFTTTVKPAIGSDYPGGTRFCLNDQGIVTSVIGTEAPTLAESVVPAR